MNLSSKPIAMSYVPWQKWESLYDPHKALQVGTIFAELNQPFTGKPVIAPCRERTGCCKRCSPCNTLKGGNRNGFL